MPIIDPWFYAAAIPAVVIAGIAKGGFGGGFAMLSVPLMALVVSPARAAAIMLPILLIMDVVSIGAYHRQFHRPTVAAMIPGAILGIALGGLVFGSLEPDVLRVLLGLIALLFVGYSAFGGALLAQARPADGRLAALFGGISGFTSTIAHAGGPPAQFYLLPLRMTKTELVATMVIFFAIVNFLKLVPYWIIGQFGADNLWTSLALTPLAPLGTWAGIWLHKRINERMFYRVVYLSLALTGIKLVYDGVM